MRQKIHFNPNNIFNSIRGTTTVNAMLLLPQPKITTLRLNLNCAKDTKNDGVVKIEIFLQRTENSILA